MYCVTLATILSIQSEHDWYYIACKKCNGKVHKREVDDHGGQPDTEGDMSGDKNDIAVNIEVNATKYYCTKCKTDVFAIVLR